MRDESIRLKIALITITITVLAINSFVLVLKVGDLQRQVNELKAGCVEVK